MKLGAPIVSLIVMSILGQPWANAAINPRASRFDPVPLKKNKKQKAHPELDTEHGDPKDDPTIVRYGLKKVISQGGLATGQIVQDILESPVTLPVLLVKDIATPSYEKLLRTDPEIFDLFKIHQHRYQPRLEYGPTLVNSNYEYQGISDRRFGYCWGYSTMDRYFTVLAFFDKDVTENEHVPAYENKAAWLSYYKGKVDRVLRGKATLIPGFANLREFTLVPEIELYMKLKAMNLWADRALRFSSLPIFKNSTEPMNALKRSALLTMLKEKIARGELPKILFTSSESAVFLGGSTDVHSVLVTGVEENGDGSGRIYIWDINFYTETLATDPKFIEIRGNGEMHYAPWHDPGEPNVGTQLGEVQLAPEDREETVQMLRSLKKFCTKNPLICTEKTN